MISSALRHFFRGNAAACVTPSAPPPVTVDALGNPTRAWQSGEALMADHNRTVLMKRLNQMVGLPLAHFEMLYRDVILSFAEFVQLMPASEAHHHARFGGLLDHSLDVAERAVSIRRGYLLPPDRPPEVVARSADRWTYGVFLAALFHDVGKPATDLEVTLYDTAGKSLGAWNPGSGPMEKAVRYYVSFRADRRYDQHERMAPFIGRSLIPAKALDWLCEDQDLMSSWLAALAGDHDAAGVVGAIVAQADGQSVAKDLGVGKGSRLPSSQKRPLSEMLLVALKQIFEEACVQINRPGAEAWVTETDLWLVSKVGSDLMRSWLIGQGYGSVPQNNNRVFDELQQHKICTSASEDKAVWSVRIEAGEFDETLTMLRFPIETVWPDTDRRPAPLEGTITPRGVKLPPGKENAAKPSSSCVPGPVMEGDDLASSDEADELSAMAVPDGMRRQVSRTTINWEATGHRFFGWLAEGISEGRLKINADSENGDLWTVEEGLLICTPEPLRRLSKEHGIEDYVAFQKALIRQGALLMNTKQPPTTNIHYELMLGARAVPLNGNVLINPSKTLGIKLPGAAPNLTRVRCKHGFL